MEGDGLGLRYMQYKSEPKVMGSKEAEGPAHVWAAGFVQTRGVNRAAQSTEQSHLDDTLCGQQKPVSPPSTASSDPRRYPTCTRLAVNW